MHAPVMYCRHHRVTESFVGRDMQRLFGGGDGMLPVFVQAHASLTLLLLGLFTRRNQVLTPGALTSAHGDRAVLRQCALCRGLNWTQEAIDEEEMSSFARSISAASLGSGDRDGDLSSSRLGSSPHLGRAHPSGAPAAGTAACSASLERGSHAGCRAVLERRQPLACRAVLERKHTGLPCCPGEGATRLP